MSNIKDPPSTETFHCLLPVGSWTIIWLALFQLKKKNLIPESKKNIYLPTGIHLSLKDTEMYFELYSHCKLSQKTETSVKSTGNVTQPTKAE